MPNRKTFSVLQLALAMLAAVALSYPALAADISSKGFGLYARAVRSGR